MKVKVKLPRKRQEIDPSTEVLGEEAQELLAVVKKSILEGNNSVSVPPKLDLYSVATALREKEKQIRHLQRIIKSLETKVETDRPLDLPRLLNIVNKVVSATKGSLNKKKK